MGSSNDWYVDFQLRQTYFSDPLTVVVQDSSGGDLSLGIKLSPIPLSKNTLLVAAQLVVNVLLATWLYNEYVHNPFMQTYIATAWSTIWPIIAVVTGIAVGAAGVFVVFRRGHLASQISETRSTSGSPTGSLDNLEPIDNCPFCNLPLKTISEGRLQCRNCRRYFKSGLPKASLVSA